MPTEISSTLLEVVVGGTDGIQVGSALLEAVVAPDVDSTQVHSALLEVVVAADLPEGDGGPGGDCPGFPAGVRLWWALDVEFGGLTFHFGTRDGEIDGVVYRGGLGDLELSRLAELGGSVSVTITSADDWPDIFRTAGWLVDGGRARIYLVIEGPGSAVRRTLWVDGRVDGTRWGIRGEPISLSVVPSVRIGTLPDQQAVVDFFTRPAQEEHDAQLGALLVDATEFEVFENSIGMYYPLIVGAPGHIEGGTPYCCVPAPAVQVAMREALAYDADDPVGGPAEKAIDVPEVFIHVVAVGTIHASSCYAIDTGIVTTVTLPEPGNPNRSRTVEIPQRTASPTGTLKVGRDALGNYCTWQSQSFTPVNETTGEGQSGDPELYVGFDRSIGGGVMHGGRPVNGAADIFEWIVQTYTGFRLDLGRQKAHAQALNRYLIDTWVNESIDAMDWFNEAVLEYVPAAIVRGEEGIYLAHLPLRATRTDSVLDLVEGRNAQRGGRSVTSAAEVVNHLTYSWGQARDGQSYVFTHYLSDQHRSPQPLPGGTVYGDARVLPHALCAASQNAYGLRPGRLELRTIWDAATAHKIADDFVIRRSFPERTIRYTLGVEHHWLAPGDVVTLTDDGLKVTERLCTVVDVVVSLTEIEVTLRPVRTTTSYL